MAAGIMHGNLRENEKCIRAWKWGFGRRGISRHTGMAMRGMAISRHTGMKSGPGPPVHAILVPLRPQLRRLDGGPTRDRGMLFVFPQTCTPTYPPHHTHAPTVASFAVASFVIRHYRLALASLA